MELNREQIIKALECCPEQEYCRDCPYDIECMGMEFLILDALSLIKELTEENERWKAEAENQSIFWRQHFESIYESAKETVKENTVRKMLEMVKRRASTVGNSYANGETVIIQYCVSPQALDQIAKEMLERENDVRQN